MSTPTASAPDLSTRRLLATAWPLALHGSVTVLVAANDVVLVAREGATVVASVVVATAVLTVAVVAVGALGTAAQIEVSRARGAGDDALVGASTTSALRVVLGIGLPVLAVLLVVAGPLTMALAGSAADPGLAATYLRLTLLGLPAALVAAVLRAHATGLARSRSVLVAGLVTAGTDVAVSLALLPALGWRGVALGTVAGYAAGALVLLLDVGRLPAALRPRLPLRAAGREAVLWRLGWPDALLALFSSASWIVVVVVLAASPPVVLAASRVLDLQLMVAWVCLYAVGSALLTLLGEAVGAGRPDLVATAVRRAAVVLAVAALVLYGVGAAASWQVARLVAGAEVAAVVGALGWLAWAQVAWQACGAAAVAVCRALRDTRAGLRASLVAEYAVFLPAGLLLCRWLGLDLLGVLVAHHLFWATYVAIVVTRARRRLGEARAAASEAV